MKTHLKTGVFILAIWMVSLFCAGNAGAQTRFDRFVVFGTSLSDTGNFFVLGTEVNVAPGYVVDPLLLVPDASYPRGGLNMSNGALWITKLAQSVHKPQDVLPATRSDNPRARNYATDGTRAWPHPTEVRFSDQVDTFLQDVGEEAPSRALYVIEIGSNDVRDALGIYLSLFNPTDPNSHGTALAAAQEILNAAIARIETELDLLISAGAGKFLYLNVPPIGVTPAIRNLDSFLGAGGSISALANFLAQTFNTQLEQVFSDLTDSEVVALDVFGITLQVISDPENFGLTNVTDPCLTPGVAPFACTRPDKYFFWDGVHPTEAAHAIFSEQAAVALGID